MSGYWSYDAAQSRYIYHTRDLRFDRPLVGPGRACSAVLDRTWDQSSDPFTGLPIALRAISCPSRSTSLLSSPSAKERFPGRPAPAERLASAFCESPRQNSQGGETGDVSAALQSSLSALIQLHLIDRCSMRSFQHACIGIRCMRRQELMIWP